MLRLLTHIGETLNTLSDYIGRYLPWLMLPFIFITFATAILRYLFDYGNIGLQETSVYLHAVILMLCMGYTLHRDEHVRIDIFYNKMSPRNRAIVNLIGGVLFLMPISLTILAISFDYALRSWILLEQSLEIGGLPLVFILKSLIPAMAALLFVQGCADISLNLKRIIQR